MGVLTRPNKMRQVMFKDDRGSILLTAMLLVFLLSLIGLSSLRQVDNETASSSDQRASVQAFYLAEAGLERAKAKLNADPAWAASVDGEANAFTGDNSLGTGSYVVQVFWDDPVAGNIRVQTRGYANGFFDGVAASEVVGVDSFSGAYPLVFDYAHFICGNLQLPAGNTQIRGDMYTGGNLEMTGSGANRIQGDVSVLGGVTVFDDGNIVGDVTANGSVELDSSYTPNIKGDVRAGGDIIERVSNAVDGSTTDQISSPPVTDLCDSSELVAIAITSEEIDALKSQATQVVSTSLSLDSEALTLNGIVHVLGNLELSGELTLSDNVVFIVDGNVSISGPGHIRSDPAGDRVTVLVPGGNVQIEGGGDFIIDGQLQVGQIDESGSIGGGDVQVQDSRLVVNGSLGILNGNLQLNGTSTLKLSWQDPDERKLLLRDSESVGFILKHWREVSN